MIGLCFLRKPAEWIGGGVIIQCRSQASPDSLTRLLLNKENEHDVTCIVYTGILLLLLPSFLLLGLSCTIWNGCTCLSHMLEWVHCKCFCMTSRQFLPEIHSCIHDSPHTIHFHNTSTREHNRNAEKTLVSLIEAISQLGHKCMGRGTQYIPRTKQTPLSYQVTP